ncbi:SusC/RagA family TonB-linked outer membrane protein [Sphingobacterium suaedae]|uniref:SusC/RagA family TonB-linked outer membrane protein n=1 Tax=Sphingobacterium suaedae TaxID=1686402 RepID=A0ABW5KPU4_9SPHI
MASSVAQLDMSKTKTRPIFKMQEAFSGTIPGVTMLQGSNLPGMVPGTISIRGISTLKNADALVIVDGMEQSITDIDPNQIKSVTVLKDAASTSMYGSRGANGVIIVETERGYTGQFKVDINTWTAINSAIDKPDFVGAAQYMKVNNWAREHQGQTPQFTAEDIAKAESGEIPTVNWLDEVMQRRAYAHNTSANISGGGGVGTFNLMLGHVKENGLNAIEGTEKFSARFNTNINIADRFVLLADFYAHRLQVDRLMANDNGHGLYQLAWRMNPTQQIFYDSDLPEHYILHNNINPLASIAKGGIKNYVHDRSTINLRPRYNINKNLNIEGNVSYIMNKSANKEKRKTFKFYDGNGAPVTIWNNAVAAEQGVSTSLLTARALVNYNSTLRGDQDKIYLTLGSEIMNEIRTDYRETSKASFFGKLNYSFDNRYLLEVTGRADGSSKFAPEHKWGFFPSVALAWNAHNESFMQSLRDAGTINNLKVRASYGLIGNENVDPYLWEEIVNNWGWTIRVPNPLFSWEKQKQWNVGLDVTALDNRLTMTAEVYNKFSYDLIYDSFTVPPLTGSNTLESAVNIGEVENKGWELSASWSDKIGAVSYKVGGMLFDNVNKMLKAGYSQSDTLIFKGDSDKVWYRGIALDNYYGFQSNGYFQDQAEVDETTAKLPNTLPGDIRYVDQNGDGLINDKDRVNLGDPFPHMNYSITLDLGWKRWDFAMIGQGVGRRTGRIVGQEAYPVLMDGESNSLGAPRQYYVDNSWTPERRDARFPRVWTGNTANEYLSDLWLSDASYFRIKMLQLGYTFPTAGRYFKNIRLYVNAQDAITFTKFEGLEPERGWDLSKTENQGNGAYPRMAAYSFGIRATIL